MRSLSPIAFSAWQSVSPSGGGATAGMPVVAPNGDAYIVWILPHSLVTISLATAMLPSASRMAAEGDLAGVAAETMRTIRLAVTALLPAAVGFLVLGLPLTQLIFGFGQGAAARGGERLDSGKWAVRPVLVGRRRRSARSRTQSQNRSQKRGTSGHGHLWNLWGRKIDGGGAARFGG